MKTKSTNGVFLKMAYSRHQFKNRVEEKVGGALYEYYKAECAQANGQTRWVEHWRTEVRRLLGELQIALLHGIRGFKNKRKAFLEVVKYVQSKDAGYRRIAESEVARDFKLKKLRSPVPEKAWDEFQRMLQKATDEVLDVDSETTTD